MNPVQRQVQRQIQTVMNHNANQNMQQVIVRNPRFGSRKKSRRKKSKSRKSRKRRRSRKFGKFGDIFGPNSLFRNPRIWYLLKTDPNFRKWAQPYLGKRIIYHR